MPPDPPSDERLEALVSAVLQSPRYRAISPSMIAVLGRRALQRRPSLGAAIKETKGALHQAGGAFMGPKMPYATWLGQLASAADGGDPTAVRGVCRAVLAGHASTRERLGVLDSFYATLCAGLPPLHSILDVACGLNPLAAPWMPLAAGASYRALDIYSDLAAFLTAALPLLGVSGRAEVGDIAHEPVSGRVDLALLLKVLPLLEHQRKGAGLRLLRSLDAPFLLVSFPTRSLGGRAKGMAQSYEEGFRSLAAAEGWALRRHIFPTELAFLVCKDGALPA